MKHIVNLSGGKDSTAMLLMMLEKQMPIDYIVFADTGKDFPQMLDHLIKLGAYIKENYPSAPKITTLRADKSFDYLMFDHKKTRGKHIGKRGYGWATKNRIVPDRDWIDALVAQADASGRRVFMKESLRGIMGGDFRQDPLIWINGGVRA